MLPVIVVAVLAQRADDDASYFSKDAVASQGRQQPVQVFDVDLDVLQKQDVALPIEPGRIFPVEEVDERGQVPADRGSGEFPDRGRGQPGGALVLDLLAHDQGKELLNVALSQPERREIDARDPGMVIKFIEEEGEIRKADEDRLSGPDDRVVLMVDLGGQVLRPRAAGHGEDQVLLPNDLLEMRGAFFGRRCDVVYLPVARKYEWTDVDAVRPDFLLQ